MGATCNNIAQLIQNVIISTCNQEKTIHDVSPLVFSFFFFLDSVYDLACILYVQPTLAQVNHTSSTCLPHGASGYYKGHYSSRALIGSG